MKVKKYVDYIVKMIPTFEFRRLLEYIGRVSTYENYRVDKVPIYKVDNPE